MPQILVLAVDTASCWIMESCRENGYYLSIIAPNSHGPILGDRVAHCTDSRKNFGPPTGLPSAWNKALCNWPPLVYVRRVGCNETPTCNSGKFARGDNTGTIYEKIDGAKRDRIKPASECRLLE